jgi:hypothetical protein
VSFAVPDKESIRRARSYPMALAIARYVGARCGYAICEHGSRQRDFDLVAVPWTDEAVSAEDFIEALRAEFKHWDVIAMHADGDHPLPRKLPHGRLCWPFHFGGGPYLDLAVMPRVPPCKGHMWVIGRDRIARCRRCKEVRTTPEELRVK